MLLMTSAVICQGTHAVEPDGTVKSAKRFGSCFFW